MINQVHLFYKIRYIDNNPRTDPFDDKLTRKSNFIGGQQKPLYFTSVKTMKYRLRKDRLSGALSKSKALNRINVLITVRNYKSK